MTSERHDIPVPTLQESIWVDYDDRSDLHQDGCPSFFPGRFSLRVSCNLARAASALDSPGLHQIHMWCADWPHGPARGIIRLHRDCQMRAAGSTTCYITGNVSAPSHAAADASKSIYQSDSGPTSRLQSLPGQLRLLHEPDFTIQSGNRPCYPDYRNTGRTRSEIVSKPLMHGLYMFAKIS